MLFHVLALGAAMFGLLGAGVAASELNGLDTQTVTETTIDASSSPSAIPADPTFSAMPSPAPEPTKALPSVIASPPKDKTTAAEDTVTTLINVERVKAGCGEVGADERLRTAARAHSADMAKQNYFSHTGKDGSSFVDRVARAGYPRNSAAGENIAMGYGTAQAVVTGWMNSDGHRRNILNCSARATGVGLAYRGNTPYWTQVFGRT